MATSYNGWPASSSPSRIGVNQDWEPIPGHDFPGGIKGGDVEAVFTYLVRNLHARVEPITIYPPGDEWGYAYRDNVNNPGQLSCHASATAIDYNATEHPNQKAYTWTREQARTINHIINEELDGVIKWLEGYDEMHFEIRGTAAQVKAVADRIRNGELDMDENRLREIMAEEIKKGEDRQNAWIKGQTADIKANAKILRDGLASLIRKFAAKFGYTI